MAKFEFRTGIYEGEAIDNIPNGKGKVTFENGAYYEGEFLDGEFHGNGKAYIKEIGYCDGLWVKTQFVKGKFTVESNLLFDIEVGAVYEGNFDHFILNGKGKMTRRNGEILEGEFINGRLNGKGTLTLPDGTVIEGDFVYGVKIHEYTDEDYENAGGDRRFGGK